MIPIADRPSNDKSTVDGSGTLIDEENELVLSKRDCQMVRSSSLMRLGDSPHCPKVSPIIVRQALNPEGNRVKIASGEC